MYFNSPKKIARRWGAAPGDKLHIRPVQGADAGRPEKQTKQP